jgi:hypothetical protein
MGTEERSKWVSLAHFSGDRPGTAEGNPARLPVMTLERVIRPLGRIANLLVEREARVSLIMIRDLLEALDARAYVEGFRTDG